MNLIEVDFGGGAEVVERPARKQCDPEYLLAQNWFRIVYQTNNFFLPQIRDMLVRKKVLNIRPEYQRRLRWTVPQKSRLIESLLLNVPIPPVFFLEVDVARYEVTDGQQRLNAISEFLAGDFALGSLKVLHPLNRMKYTDLSPGVKRTLDRATISAVILLKESEAEKAANHYLPTKDARRLVFDRLNTGSRQLNVQEIRSALNPGPLNDCIIELGQDRIFTEIFGIPPYTKGGKRDRYENPERQKNNLYSSMQDCEIVLRFFALRDRKNIRGSMKSILDRAMEMKITDEQAAQFKDDFRSRLDFLYKLFNGKPFIVEFEADRKKKVSVSLFDAAMVALDRLWEKRDTIKSDKAGVRKRLKSTLADERSYDLIVGRKNTAESIKGRIGLLQMIFSPG